MKVDTVIIGSGICGLSAAHFLSKRHKDFVVLEENDKVGGIIQTQISKGFTCENGPNTVLLNNPAIETLIKDLGLWKNIKFPIESSNKNRFVFQNGRITKIPMSIKEFVLSPLLSFSSKCRLLMEPFVKKHNKNTNVFDFVSRRFGKEFHDNLIEPFLTGVYAGDTKKMSAKHSLKMFWNLEQSYGSVFRGLIFRDRTRIKKIKSFNFSGGLMQLTNQISSSIGSQIKLNYRVEKILKKGDGYVIINGLRKIECNKVICTIPSYSLKKIIWDKTFSKNLELVQYNPIDVFHFGFYNKNIKNYKKGFGLLTKPSDNKSFLGILFSTEIFHFVSPSDSKLFTVLVGGERQREFCEIQKEKLELVILKELEKLIGHSGKLIFKNHFRWKKGIPQYNMYQEDLTKSIKLFQKKNRNFHIIGNYFDGLSVSDCVEKGEKVVNK